MNVQNVENVAIPDFEKLGYRLDHFEGPLDLLLFLIRKNEVNIYDIPIAEITKQYLDYLRFAQTDLDDISEFHLTAATLLYIKSRMLLPIDVDIAEELEDPRQELVQRLIEYERFRKLTDAMAEHQSEQSEWTIDRRHTQPVLPFPNEQELWEKAAVWDLLKSFSSIMKRLGGEKIISLWEEVSINEKITLVMEFLENRQEFGFDDIIANPQSLMEIVSAFLAVLEMVKGGVIDVYQNRLFGDIKIVASDRSKRQEYE